MRKISIETKPIWSGRNEGVFNIRKITQVICPKMPLAHHFGTHAIAPENDRKSIRVMFRISLITIPVLVVYFPVRRLARKAEHTGCDDTQLYRSQLSAENASIFGVAP